MPTSHGKGHHCRNKRAPVITDYEEVWFAGCHCGSCIWPLYRCTYGEGSLRSLFTFDFCFVFATDIGGGSVLNKTRNSLARIPLRWMIRECFKAGTGIMFHRATLYKVGLDPDTLRPEILWLGRPPPSSRTAINIPFQFPDLWYLRRTTRQLYY